MQQIRTISGPSTAVVFPSDHLLADEALDQIRAAEPLAEDYLVTFGVCPKSPHTGYGYIRPGKPVPPGFAVDEFKEKPDEKTAREYVEKGYLWNSGIFLLSTDRFFSELKRYSPDLFAAFGGTTTPDYGSLESISIDYGLLERSPRVAVVPLETAWNDLGTFKAFFDAGEHDAEGNVGKADYIDARNNYVHAPDKHVGLIGVNDLVVVDTADALLVCDNRQTEQVKMLVSLYNKRDNPVTLFHRKVHRPWGSYTILEDSGFYKIKRVTVKPGKKLSLQLHHHRSEHWVIVSGTAEVTLDGDTILLRQGESTFVRTGTKHRLRNPGVIPLEVIEVQLGEYLEENDIVRFEDDYGRDKTNLQSG
jgi:mannose-1-phosphate guanylyltransferase/mannose-6-phosphate isomerase